MELQIPYCACAKVPSEGILLRKESSSRENTAAVMRMEGSKSDCSGSMPGSHPSIRRNSTKDCSIELYGVPQRQEQHMLYEQFGELKYKFRNREFWCRGYYVDTVGKNESRIKEYVENQLKEDEMGEQLRIPSYSPFTGRK